MTATITINGRKVTVPKTATILEAAHCGGITIPTLCHHPELSNVGACRMCVVSVEGARGLQTACTTPVVEGMVVDTESEEARETRKFALEMLLTGRYVSAQKALQLGLINRVVPLPDLEKATRQLASEIADASRYVLALGKQGFYAQVDQTDEAAFDYATNTIALNLGAEDAQIGIRAFLDKKKPEWINR